MLGDQDIHSSLISAVHEGNIERTRELVLLVCLTHKHGQKDLFYFVMLLRMNIQKLLNCF
jgi:hypothetical protein